MNNYFKIWLEGWKVIWRLIVFRLTVILLASPLILLHIFITKQLKEGSNTTGMTAYAIYTFAGTIIIFPFLYFIASKLRGEFIYPRYKARQIEETETSSNPSSEPPLPKRSAAHSESNNEGVQPPGDSVDG